MSFDFDSLNRKPQGRSSNKPAPEFNFGDNSPAEPSSNPGSAPSFTAPSSDNFGVCPPVSHGASRSSTRSSSAKSSRSSSKSASARSSHGVGKQGNRGSGKNLLENQNLILAVGGGIIILLLVVVMMMTSAGPASSGSANGQLSSSQKSQLDQYINQGMNYNESGQYQKAVEAFKAAYKIDPADGYAVDQIAILYRTHLNDPEQSEYWEQKKNERISGALSRSKGVSADYWDKKNGRK